jgi:CRISPR system Cascade subunit CasA
MLHTHYFPTLNNMSFNLTKESWIPVVNQDWQLEEISLIELFQTWGNLREIQGDNPPTILALHRFLIALLHHVYQGPKNEEHWEEIRDDDGQKVIEYLQSNQELFDILHPDQPFMQDPKLTVDLAGEIYQAYYLHGNNTSTVFCHEHEWSGSSISIAAGARLVIRLHTFDVGGRKPGSSVSAGVIPTMNAANVLVRGKTLKETLLLNLMQYDLENDKPSPKSNLVKEKDLPVWEREIKPAAERIPAGYIDYLTLQRRRVKLFCEGGKAVKIAFHQGDSLPRDISPTECGIAYRKTNKGDIFTVRLDLNRSLWRDSAAFLQSSDAGTCPRIIEWLADLQAAGLVEDRLNLQILGLTVDNAKPLGWTSEQFSAPIAYLDPKQRPLWDALAVVLKVAEETQQVFRSFKGSAYHALAEVLKGEAGKLASSLNGESRYWAALDQLFPPLLQDLLADRSEDLGGIRYGDKATPQWTKDVQNAARKAFAESIKSIRNYEARAKALRSLEYQLAKLRGDIPDKKPKKATASVS